MRFCCQYLLYKNHFVFLRDFMYFCQIMSDFSESIGWFLTTFTISRIVTVLTWLSFIICLLLVPRCSRNVRTVGWRTKRHWNLTSQAIFLKLKDRLFRCSIPLNIAALFNRMLDNSLKDDGCRYFSNKYTSCITRILPRGKKLPRHTTREIISIQEGVLVDECKLVVFFAT